MGILNADKEAIASNADKLGVGELARIFACMVSGRSWKSILKGIDKSEKNAQEVSRVATSCCVACCFINI